MITLILLIIVGCCLLGVAVIVIRKFPLLAQVEISTLGQEREISLKKRLLEERFIRKLKVFFSWVSKYLKPFAAKMMEEFHRWLDVVTRREQKMRIQKLRSLSSEGVHSQDSERFMREVDSLIETNHLNDAESRLVEFVALHPRDVQSYKRLAEIAVIKKEFVLAKEIYEFIIKIDERSQLAYSGLGRLLSREGTVNEAKRAFEKSVSLRSKDPNDFYSLAKIYQTTGELGKALEMAREAHELQPQNPKFLDKLAEIAILEKRKTLAKNAYLKLKKTNPENEKLEELKRQIDSI